jgi:hypothetical protein
MASLAAPQPLSLPSSFVALVRAPLPFARPCVLSMQCKNTGPPFVQPTLSVCPLALPFTCTNPPPPPSPISLLSRLEPRKGEPSATKSLVIVNSIELAKQVTAQVRQQRPDWTVEIEQGGMHKASGDADLSVLAMFMVDQLSNLQKEPSQRTKLCSRQGTCTSSRRKVSRP